MTELQRNLTRSVFLECGLRLVKDDRTLAEVEAEIDEVWAELEPLMRTHDALVKRAIELREAGDAM